MVHIHFYESFKLPNQNNGPETDHLTWHYCRLLLQTFILFLCPLGGSRWAPTHTRAPRPGSTLVATLIGTITTCLISTDSTARLQPPPPTSNPQGSACQETERKALPFPPLINITSASSASSQMYRASGRRGST